MPVLRSRRPDPFFPGPQCTHEGLERENEALRAGLAEALGCFRFVLTGHAELDYWRADVMAPAVYERLLELVAPRE